ncbi:MAG TPA: hypothetical protein G4O05_00315, partial [Caldilineae bacterium]|nr:hypothetical protein [Caldilineae bacterium]
DSSSNWWIVLLYGALSIILGLFFLFYPLTSLVAFVFALGVYWLVSGIVTLIHMVQDRTAWGWQLFSGVLGIVAGLMVISRPLWAALVVPTIYVIIIAITGIFMGILLLIAAFKGAGWGAGIMGALTVILGIILWANPLIAAAALPWVFGVFTLLGGIINVFAAFKMK